MYNYIQITFCYIVARPEVLVLELKYYGYNKQQQSLNIPKLPY